MNVLVFGAGENYWIYKKWLSGHKVMAVLDNAENLWHTHIDGHEIVPPADIEKYNFDRIYILSSYVADIQRQLLALGIAENKIFHTYQLCDLSVQTAISYYPSVFDNAKSSMVRVLVFSHELTLTGAHMCLVHLVSIWVQQSIQVTVVSPTDGTLRQVLLNLGANVIIDEMMLVSDDINRPYMKDCDILFVNTLQLFYLLRKRDLRKKTIWWVHEPDCLYKYVPDGKLNSLNRCNLNIYAVSEFARKVFLRHSLFSISEVGLLPFGIPDESKSSIDVQSSALGNGITFIIVGGVSILKGYDTLLKTMHILHDWPECYEKYSIVSIGDNQNSFAKQLMHDAHDAKLPIEFKGSLSHDEAIAMIKISDVVICASREETMSAAIIEGMMLGKICITTDNTGIADYITDGVNGFIAPVSDACFLARKMMHIMEKYEELSYIKYNARKLYEKYFSMHVFENRVSNLFE